MTLVESLEWCFVPGGTFARGSEESPEEGPVLQVTLSPFRMSRYPVTNRQFRRFIAEGGYEREELWTQMGWKMRCEQGWVEPNYMHSAPWNAEEVPVTGVSYWEALAYAGWAGASLPTEAQWEYAAKGPECRAYPWGNAEPTLDLATFSPDCQPIERAPTAVDAHPKNRSPFGCEDMSGNFGEWCLDNARTSYSGDVSLVDPLFVTREEDAHVVRGGSGLHDAGALRCVSRDYYFPGLRDNMIAVRLVQSEGRHA